MTILKVIGTVTPRMNADFKPLMERFSEVFAEATGERLIPGTLNVRVKTPITIEEDFKILASKLGGVEQDLLFERCRIDGIPAYRLRRFNPSTGEGSHGASLATEQAMSRPFRGRRVGLVLVAG